VSGCRTVAPRGPYRRVAETRGGRVRLLAARGLDEPALEAGLGDAGSFAGDEAALVELGAEVAGMGVGDERAWVVAGGEGSPDEVVEAELLGPGDLDDPVERFADGDSADRPPLGCSYLWKSRVQSPSELVVAAMPSGGAQFELRQPARSSRREPMSSLENTLCRWYSAVSGADEELGADLGVGLALCRQPGDLRLLRCEDTARLHAAPPYRLARRLQLPAGPFGKRCGPEPARHVVGSPQVLAGVHAPLPATEPLAVEQMGPPQPGGRWSVRPRSLGGCCRSIESVRMAGG
jgi:hypothetical protein